jgi:hypothetical protein
MSFFLSHFDVALVQFDSPPQLDGNKIILDGAVQLRDIPYFNGGVIGFRKGLEVEQFFARWRQRYQFHRFKRDQPSLVEALYTTKVRLLPLAQKWNRGASTFSSERSRRETVIWHYKVRSMDHHIESYMCQALQSVTEDPEKIALLQSYISQNRRTRGYARSPGWLIKSLVNTVRGPLSARPQQHAGPKKWKELLIGSGCAETIDSVQKAAFVPKSLKSSE